MSDLSNLKFDKNGLIPAIVADANSGAVLMLAYMNPESLQISIDEGKTCFWSRSRKKLWRKGETSGNVQHIVSIKADCDKDALLVAVKADGPACHTGAQSCFFESIRTQEPSPCSQEHEDRPPILSLQFSIKSLYNIIQDRKINKKEGSYTNYLFEKGIDKILKKLGEESTEVIISSKGDDKANTIYELADLTYHALVLMAEMGITPDDVKKELASRFVVK